MPKDTLDLSKKPKRSAIKVAEQIVNQDRRAFHFITPKQFNMMLSTVPVDETTEEYQDAKIAYKRYTDNLETIFNYVIHDVIKKTNPPTALERARTMEFWIEVMDECLKKRDHMAFVAINAALKNCNLDLPISSKIVHKNSKLRYKELSEVFTLETRSKQFEVERKLFEDYDDSNPLLPYLGSYETMRKTLDARKEAIQNEAQEHKGNKDLKIEFPEEKVLTFAQKVHTKFSSRKLEPKILGLESVETINITKASRLLEPTSSRQLFQALDRYIQETEAEGLEFAKKNDIVSQKIAQKIVGALTMAEAKYFKCLATNDFKNIRTVFKELDKSLGNIGQTIPKNDTNNHLLNIIQTAQNFLGNSKEIIKQQAKMQVEMEPEKPKDKEPYFRIHF
jgi:hypothetical protein